MPVQSQVKSTTTCQFTNCPSPSLPRPTGGLADKEGTLIAGDELISVNDQSVEHMTRTEAWNFLKKLPNAPVHMVVKRVDYGF